MAVDNNIAEKVRKLLALSGSSNEHEASLALAKAQELLAKYHLDMADIEKNKPYSSQFDKASITELTADSNVLYGGWDGSLANALAHSMFCKILYHYSYDINGQKISSVSVIGQAIDVEVVTDTYRWCKQQMLQYCEEYVGVEYMIRKLGKQSTGKVQMDKIAAGYLSGISVRVCERIREQVQSNSSVMALVAVSQGEIKQWMNQKYGRLTSGRAVQRSMDGTAYNAGRSAGERVAIQGKPREVHSGQKLLS